METTDSKNLISESELVSRVMLQFLNITGLQVPENQLGFVQTRLAKRMRALEIQTPHDYWTYIVNNEAKEMPKIISLLTTHHTFFFREYSQFEYILKSALPHLIQQLNKEGRKVIRIWSAGCSRGQEVYSLSMFLNFHLPKLAPGFTCEILGSDICNESIAIAKNGVYHWDETKEIPSMYLDDNWIQGKGTISDFVKVKDKIKNSCKFEIINLKNIDSVLGSKTFDLIFCRNVFIYFIPQRIKSITADMLRHLNPSGFLCLGFSENLVGLDLPISFLGSSIYRHKNAPSITLQESTSATAAKRLQVLCVDDSPTVLRLLAHVLSFSYGFEVVGTAKNGIEAAAFLEKNKVDLMTLDIHMPEQSGIAYLEKHFNGSHPPVVMVSTVAREDGDLALKALELGASDYVEKPALDGLVQRADEIRMKLRCAYDDARSGKKRREKLDPAFRKNLNLTSIDNKLRLIIAGPSVLTELKYILDDLVAPQPPVVVFLNGPENITDSILKDYERHGRKIEKYSPAAAANLLSDTVYLASFSDDFESVKKANGDVQVSILVLDSLSEKAITALHGWPGAHITVNDHGNLKLDSYKKLRQIAHEILPYSSFRYGSDQFFNRKSLEENKRQVVVMEPLMPKVFENSEIVKIVTNRDAIVCLFHTRKNTGAVLIAPEEILKQDSLLLEQNVNRLVTLMGTHGDNIKAKIAGPAALVRKIGELLVDQKVSIALSREVNQPIVEAYFFTDSGRLRLPKMAAPPVLLEATKVIRGKTKVLIVDDSKVMRQLLKRIIEDDGTLEVVAETGMTSEVDGLIQKFRPDVLTLDIEMPEMNGVELLKLIMPRYALPTVMISSLSIDQGHLVMQALDLGALDYIQKPQYAEISLLAPQIREKLKVAATAVPLQQPKTLNTAAKRPVPLQKEIDLDTIVAVGASTGGTTAIQNLFANLPEKGPPILVVQHIPAVFSKAFAQRLNNSCQFEVKEAADGDLILSGRALVAPGGMQMEVVRDGKSNRLRVFDSGHTHLHKPSVDVLFESIANVIGEKAVGVLLTGMGRDGAEGLLKMRKRGARTIVQDQQSCSVFGMPKAAIELGAAELVKPLDQIPESIISFLGQIKKKVA